MIFKQPEGTAPVPASVPQPKETPAASAPQNKQENFLILSEPKKACTKTCDLFARQVAHELSNERLYMVFAGWCNAHGFPETSRFFMERSAEEHKHAMAFIDHVQKIGKSAPIPHTTDDKCPPLIDLESLLVGALERELETSGMIGEMFDQAQADKDHTALPLILKYLDEQVEEEQWARSLLRLWRLCKASGSIVDFENEIGSVNDGKHKIGDM